MIRAAAVRAEPGSGDEHSLQLLAEIAAGNQSSSSTRSLRAGTAIHWHGRYRTRRGMGLLMRWDGQRFMQEMASGLAAYAHQQSPDKTP